MRKSRFSENQIVGILKELKAGAKAAALCRKYGMSEATLYNWRSKYAGLEVELPRFRAGLRLGHQRERARPWLRVYASYASSVSQVREVVTTRLFCKQSVRSRRLRSSSATVPAPRTSAM
jgi:putative transposase